MRDQDLRAIVERLRTQRTDDEYAEAKTCATKLSNDVWESVSAFANTNGGVLLLGVNEKNGFKPAKGFAADRVINEFVEGMGDGNPQGARLSNPPTYHLHRLKLEKLPVVVVEIDELAADEKPCFIAGRGIVGGSYKRVDDKDIKLSANEVYALNHYLTPSHADRRVVDEATVDDLDMQLVDDYLAQKKDARALKGARSKRAKMERLNILDKQGNVRLAGLLVFGVYPQQYFPKYVVDVAVHPGVVKSDPTSPLRFLDREICEGTIGEVINGALYAISRNLRTESYIRGAGRIDQLEMPEEVIREALTNALVNREYSPGFEGEAVTVDVFADRIEVTNPGGLWGGKTRETLSDGVSACRNQTLMKLVSEVGPSHGVGAPARAGVPVEGNGGGVPFMIKTMVERGLPEPRFEPGIDYFKVILLRSGATRVSEMDGGDSRQVDMYGRKVAMYGRKAAFPSDAAVTGRRPMQSRWTRGEWESHILDALDAEAPRSVHEIADAIGRRVGATRGYVAQLVADGKVVATAPPTSKDRKYLLAK